MGRWEVVDRKERCSSCNGLGSTRHGQDATGESVWWECSVCDGTRELEIHEQVWVDDSDSVQKDARHSVPDFMSGSWPQPPGQVEEQRWEDALRTAAGASVSATAGLEHVDEMQLYDARYRASLEKHGVIPDFVPFHSRVLAEAQAADGMSYEEWRNVRESGAIANTARYIAGECAEELLEAVIHRTLIPSPFVGMAIDVSGGLQGLVDEARWNQPDDRERRAYRIRAAYVSIMAHVADFKRP